MRHLFQAAILLIFCWVHTASVVRGQTTTRARAHVDTLCAPSMYGRGYTFEGGKKAAEYIREEFRLMGLQPLGEDYFQPFQLNVNTFPAHVALEINREVLVPGRDYIVDQNSTGRYGKGKIRCLDTLVFTDKKAQEKFMKLDLVGNVLVYDEKWDRLTYDLPTEVMRKFLTVGAVIVLHEKLTFGVGRQQLRFPKFRVLKERFPRKPRKVTFQLDAVLEKFHVTQNVVGVVEGTAHPDSFLIVGSHYDHLGTLGEHIYFPGGNDNASGTAMMLEVARYFTENPPEYSILFVAFGAEEAGLVGSLYYVNYPLVPLRQTKFMLNLDLFGTGEEGMTVVNGSVFREEYALLTRLNEAGEYLPAIKKRGRAANSDHYPFSESGVKSFFFYLMGDWQNYHDIYDDASVPLTRFPEAYALTIDFLEALQIPVK